MANATIDFSDKRGHVYTLQLQNDCYYVGWSSQLDHRIAQHFSGKGSAWTQLHKPVQVLQCIPGTTALENSTTIALMCSVGWEKVRGGLWNRVDMESPPEPIRYALKTDAKQGLKRKDLHGDTTTAKARVGETMLEPHVETTSVAADHSVQDAFARLCQEAPEKVELTKALDDALRRSLSAHDPSFGKTEPYLMGRLKNKRTGFCYGYSLKVRGSGCRYCLNKGSEHAQANVYFVIRRNGIQQRCFNKSPVKRAYGTCDAFASASTELSRDLTCLLFPRENDEVIGDAVTSPSNGSSNMPIPHMQTVITITQQKQDRESISWRAEIRNEKASQECPKRGFKCIYAGTFRDLVNEIEQWDRAPDRNLHPLDASQEEVPSLFAEAERVTEAHHTSSGQVPIPTSSRYAWQTDDSIVIKRQKIYGDYARKVSGNDCAWQANIRCEKASRAFQRGFKCVHAATEDRLNEAIDAWLSEEDLQSIGVSSAQSCLPGYSSQNERTDTPEGDEERMSHLKAPESKDESSRTSRTGILHGF